MVQKVGLSKNYLDHINMLYNSGMEPTKPKMGRPPKLPEEKLEHFSIRITPAQRAKIETYGLDWLRKLIDRAKPPKPEG